MEYSRVGVPLKTGRSFVSSSYSRGGEKRRKEGGDMFFSPISPHHEHELFFLHAHVTFIL